MHPAFENWMRYTDETWQPCSIIVLYCTNKTARNVVIFQFFKRAAVRHPGFVMHILYHPLRVVGVLYIIVQNSVDIGTEDWKYASFNVIRVWLENAIFHAPFGEGLGKNRRKWKLFAALSFQECNNCHKKIKPMHARVIFYHLPRRSAGAIAFWFFWRIRDGHRRLITKVKFYVNRFMGFGVLTPAIWPLQQCKHYIVI